MGRKMHTARVLRLALVALDRPRASFPKEVRPRVPAGPARSRLTLGWGVDRARAGPADSWPGVDLVKKQEHPAYGQLVPVFQSAVGGVMLFFWCRGDADPLRFCVWKGVAFPFTDWNDAPSDVCHELAGNFLKRWQSHESGYSMKPA